MASFEVLPVIVLAVLAIVSAFIATIVGTKEWQKAIPFGVNALVLSILVVVLVVNKSKPPAPDSAIGLTGRDSYQVMLEETNLNGKTLVIVRDNSGKFYASEFDEPLGVSEVLVVSKERFKPLLWPEVEVKAKIKSEKATSSEAAEFLK